MSKQWNRWFIYEFRIEITWMRCYLAVDLDPWHLIGRDGDVDQSRGSDPRGAL